MVVIQDELDHFKEKFKNILLVFLSKVQIQTGSGSKTLAQKSCCSDSCLLKVRVNRVRLSLCNEFGGWGVGTHLPPQKFAEKFAILYTQIWRSWIFQMCNCV